AARRDYGVDADAGDVRAERGTQLELPVRVRRVDDRPPRDRAEPELDDVARDGVGQELPVHRREVVEEDADGVEEVAHAGLRMPEASVGYAPAATRTQSVAKPRKSPSS